MADEVLIKRATIEGPRQFYVADNPPVPRRRVRFVPQLPARVEMPPLAQVIELPRREEKRVEVVGIEELRETVRLLGELCGKIDSLKEAVEDAQAYRFSNFYIREVRSLSTTPTLIVQMSDPDGPDKHLMIQNPGSNLAVVASDNRLLVDAAALSGNALWIPAGTVVNPLELDLPAHMPLFARSATGTTNLVVAVWTLRR